MAVTLPRKPKHIEYPTSDGKPMAETDKHRRLMMYVIDALTVHYKGRSDVYVAGNNFLFWEEGNPKARISPDVYVVFGPSPDDRDSYMAWKEGGRLPSVVFEFTSKKTQREDTDTKLPLYERVLQTPEYFLFDPTGDYLRPRLQGYRLQDGRYVRLEMVDNRLHSEQLGLDLVQEGEGLRLFDPRRQIYLLTPEEQAERIERESRRADAENQRADAEARRADEEKRRADEEAEARRAEARRADEEAEARRAEARRADEEAEARRAAEAEIARMRAEMKAMRERGPQDA